MMSSSGVALPYPRMAERCLRTWRLLRLTDCIFLFPSPILCSPLFFSSMSLFPSESVCSAFTAPYSAFESKSFSPVSHAASSQVSGFKSTQRTYQLSLVKTSSPLVPGHCALTSSPVQVAEFWKPVSQGALIPLPSPSEFSPVSCPQSTLLSNSGKFLLGGEVPGA
ncbi:hypothetical protein H1C71_033782 [Ictidomys tridecemlineatus]|nr:hypothetical protein H1C71_033782 [Ictidomys tridecemlineatus]